jgi:peptide deformylase
MKATSILTQGERGQPHATIMRDFNRIRLGLFVFLQFVSILEAEMAVREILRMGDARLLRVAAPVANFDTAVLHALVDDLVDTMRAADGAGLAAPQIGVDLAVVIFGFSQNARYPDAPEVPFTVLCNPRIEPLSDVEEEGWEGCLSVPGLRGVVPRLSRIRYSGFDQHGQPIDRMVDGFHARVVQHECDHLIGKLYPMRMRDFSRFGFLDALDVPNLPAD